MQQHREGADFLRDLVGHDGQRRDDAQVHVGEEGGSDQHAVEQVVQGVTHQHQRAAGLAPGVVVVGGVVVVVVVSVTVVVLMQMAAGRVRVALVVVAMPPEQEFLEDEEQRDAGDERNPHLVDPGGARVQHRVRDQRQQCRAEQCSGGKTHQVWQHSLALPGRQSEEYAGREDRKHARDERAEDYPGERDQGGRC
jgi:hypothetical protein